MAEKNKILEQTLLETKSMLSIRYSELGKEIASANFAFRSDLKYHTAATDGKTIYFDPDYFLEISEDDRLFLIAHEFLHIKFKHVFRQILKDGKKRDMDVWNEATDAIINANLARDGFKIKEGYINRPEALNYSAEEFYEILLKEKQEEEKNKQNKEPNEHSENDEDTKKIMDDHSLWEEAFEKYQKQEEQKEEEISYNEKEELENHRQKRKEKAKEELEKLKNELLEKLLPNKENPLNLGDIGEAKNEIRWEELLRKEIEEVEETWTQRRSIRENNYAYRLIEEEDKNDCETEVMIDVSDSVKIELVRGFLRIIKPILRESKMKVGCFNAKFWDFQEIHSVSEINDFEIPQESRGIASYRTDLDLAARSFTKRKEINKIVLTDGYPTSGCMPKEDLKGENIIWIVYGNEDFHPCCGKVIQISESQLEKICCSSTGKKTK